MNCKRKLKDNWKKIVFIGCLLIAGFALAVLLLPVFVDFLKLAFSFAGALLTIGILWWCGSADRNVQPNNYQAEMVQRTAWIILAGGVAEACRKTYGFRPSVDLLRFQGPYGLGTGFYFSIGDEMLSPDDLRVFRLTLDKQIARVSGMFVADLRKKSLVKVIPGLAFVSGQILNFPEFSKILESEMSVAG